MKFDKISILEATNNAGIVKIILKREYPIELQKVEPEIFVHANELTNYIPVKKVKEFMIKNQLKVASVCYCKDHQTAINICDENFKQSK